MNNDTIIKEFKKQFGHLEKYGLEIGGVVHLIGDHNVISISTPFIFDRTKLPKQFMGLDLRDGNVETDLPNEFKISDSNKEYIWAYQRFEEYVDNNADHIRNTLHNPAMTREHMLNALCFGNFEKHKQDCIRWEREGTIPKWTKKGNG